MTEKELNETLDSMWEWVIKDEEVSLILAREHFVRVNRLIMEEILMEGIYGCLIH